MKHLSGLLFLLLPLIAAAEVVVPIASVKEHVNIRMSPDPSSEIVGRLYQGDSMRLVERMAGWYEIDISGGATGFISIDWVVVLDEFPPVSEDIESAGEPVPDLPTGTVTQGKGGPQTEAPEDSEVDPLSLEAVDEEHEPGEETVNPEDPSPNGGKSGG